SLQLRPAARLRGRDGAAVRQRWYRRPGPAIRARCSLSDRAQSFLDPARGCDLPLHRRRGGQLRRPHRASEEVLTGRGMQFEFGRPSVMIEKFAICRGTVRTEFLDLNHASKSMFLVSLLIPKFARDASIEVKRTSESGH